MLKFAALRCAVALPWTLFIAALFSIGPAVADERYAPRAQMPFVLSDGGSPVIQMQVNDQGPFWFILDTGATGTTIRPNVVAFVRPPRMAAQISGLQAMGGTLSADIYRLDSVGYGPLRAANVLAPLFELPASKGLDLGGVAGIDIMRGHAIEFDFSARALRLHSGFRGGRGWTRAPVRFDAAGYAFVPFTVNGVSGLGFIDTGAASSILNRAFVASLGLEPGTHGVQRVADVGGVEGLRVPLYSVPARAMTLGPNRVLGVPIQFADVSIFSRLGGPGQRIAIVGADILARQRVVIDYPGKAVWFHSP